MSMKVKGKKIEKFHTAKCVSSQNYAFSIIRKLMFNIAFALISFLWIDMTNTFL